jgi:diguanylate cyclase (GGDEF)-like protein/PAS domain S-box-containing protein/putative nucleotidyltransferase with HDIG domain
MSEKLQEYKSKITELKNQNTELQRYLSVTKDLFCVFTYSGQIVAVNPNWKDALGYEEFRLVGKNIFEIILKEDMYATKFAISESVKEGGMDKFINRIMSMDGEPHYFEWRVKIFEKKIYASGRDISDLMKTQVKLEYYHTRDSLTGMYQRNYLWTSPETVVLPYKLPLSAIFVDLNGLKLINDSYGHDQGDELLRGIAEWILSFKRKDDIFVRYGGDEFVLLLPYTNSRTAQLLADELQKKEGFKISGRFPSQWVSISLGVATKTGAEDSVEDLIAEADRLMYEDKLRKSRKHKNSIIDGIKDNPRLLRKWDLDHANNVAKYAKAIAKEMGLEPSIQEMVEKAGFVHDIGKITVPSQILNKQSELTKREAELIRRHPESGYQILRSVDVYAPLAMIVLSHHEWFNGEGYPEQLKKYEIPLPSRIIAVADAYDAMTSGRSYCTQKNKAEALEELKKYSGTQFDPQVVSAFIEAMGSKSDDEQHGKH